MTNSVDGLSLDDNLTLTGPVNQPLVAMSVRKTFGRTVVQHLPTFGGRVLVLATHRGQNGVAGIFTGGQADQLSALRDAGQVVELVHHRGTFSVVIMTIDLEPINGIADPGPTTLLVGSVTMIEV